MRRLVLLFSFLLGPAAAAGTVRAADYTGNVGRMEASFSLDWHHDGSVTGTYHYPKRPGITYRLVGENPREGELRLDEYTGETLTARCRLHKRIEGSRIVWEGTMANTDGRRFPMAFARERNGGGATDFFDEYEKERKAVLSAAPPAVVWEDFPRSDEIVKRVPVDFEGSHYFNARVLRFENGAEGCVLAFEIGFLNGSGDLHYDGGPVFTLTATRPIPVAPERLLGREITAQFRPDGSLYSLELISVAVTHVRRTGTGKLEVRGLLDLFDPAQSFDESPEEFARRMREAPIAEFVPDKLALFHEPEPTFDAVSFQTIRLVREFGLVIQSTDAGPGMLELESLSLDRALDSEPAAIPWISLVSLDERLYAPPHQLTEQAG